MGLIACSNPACHAANNESRRVCRSCGKPLGPVLKHGGRLSFDTTYPSFQCQRIETEWVYPVQVQVNGTAQKRVSVYVVLHSDEMPATEGELRRFEDVKRIVAGALSVNRPHRRRV